MVVPCSQVGVEGLCHLVSLWPGWLSLHSFISLKSSWPIRKRLPASCFRLTWSPYHPENIFHILPHTLKLGRVTWGVCIDGHIPGISCFGTALVFNLCSIKHYNFWETYQGFPTEKYKFSNYILEDVTISQKLSRGSSLRSISFQSIFWRSL